MAHITSIGAGIYSDLSYGVESENFSTPTVSVELAYKNAFAHVLNNGSAVTAATNGGEFRRVVDVREFPQMGTPPNIVNVPVYGSKISRQVQGQADAPAFEVTLNYIPQDWQVTANYHGFYVGDGKSYPFRFSLLNALPSDYVSTDVASAGTITSGTTNGTTLTVTGVTGTIAVGMGLSGTAAAGEIVRQLTTTDAGQLLGKAGTYLVSSSLTSASITGASYAGANMGTGTVGNSQYFWTGKFEALQINPQLTDANQATLTISIQSDFVGPYTTAG